MTEVGRGTTRGLFSRRAFATAATTVAFAPLVGTSQANAASGEKVTGEPENGDVRRITLYAEKLPDGQLAY
ncbi:hypothetical protein AAH991_39480, partial [Microbispora sp. ZYX-F-249]